jgi:hypothetical protein
MKLSIRLTALAGAVVVLAGCTERPVSTEPYFPVPATPASTVPAPLATVPAPGHPMVGVYEPGAGYTQIAQFTRTSGIQPRVVLYYSGWGDNFHTSFAAAAWKQGAYTLAELEPGTLTMAQVAAGSSDPYLERLATQIRDFGHPVILSFAHEMNGNWYSWGAGHAAPEQFIAAWRHVVQFFRSQGADNVTWVWTVNAVVASSAPLRPWWPGSQWVNWVGIDGYFYFPSDTFASVFSRTLAQIRTFTNDPAFIGETAVGPGPDASSQVTALFAGAQANHLAGLVWFDKAQNDPPYHLDWHLADDPAALSAFRAAFRKYQ